MWRKILLLLTTLVLLSASLLPLLLLGMLWILGPIGPIP